MRSVISGILRRSSLVRMGPSERRQRMVPFHRPSTTESIESIGHGEISFFETGISYPPVLEALTTLSARFAESAYAGQASEVQEETNDFFAGHRDDALHWTLDRHRVCCFCFYQSDPESVGRSGAGRRDSPVCQKAGDGDAVLVLRQPAAADCRGRDA